MLIIIYKKKDLSVKKIYILTRNDTPGTNSQQIYFVHCKFKTNNIYSHENKRSTSQKLHWGSSNQDPIKFSLADTHDNKIA